MPNATTTARKPYQAGRFYPADESELRDVVERLLKMAPLAQTNQKPMGFVVPHAGYSFSGATAGCAFRQLQEARPKLIFLIAPSHHANFPLVSFWEGSAYGTPLGEYPIDQDALNQLKQHIPGMAPRRWAEEIEHSLEVQVPFLQVACPNSAIVPLLLGAQDKRNVNMVARGLMAFYEKAKPNSAAIIASSDAYHGHSLDKCRTSDSKLAQILCDMNADSLLNAVESKETMACGYGPLAITLQVAQRMGARKGSILSQTTSADVIPYRDGDYVVGYLSAMFY